ncbi:MAG: response regulator transcription factor [Chloroflexota bacterium]|nr:response regulator transcription factor [Chloroflexota bacterium]
MNCTKILIVDDEPKLVRLVQEILLASGFDVQAASSGDQAIAAVVDQKPDLVILDIVLLGDLDGFDVARRLREFSNVPIIMLTARIREEEMLRGFEAGVDDYITKPFSAKELLARVRAVLKRASSVPLQQTDVIVQIADLQIDLVHRKVNQGDQNIHLTPTEYRLLHELASHPNQVLLHEQLLSAVWGPEYRDDIDYLRIYIHLLRNKIEPDPSTPTLIVSKPGVGYLLVTD